VPFITLSPVVSVLLSMQLNGEYPESNGIFGVLMICTGAAALALARANSPPKVKGEEPAEGEDIEMLSKPGEDSKDSSQKAASKAGPSKRDEGRAIMYMIVVAVMWAVAASLQKKALKECPFIEMTAVQNSIMLVLYTLLSVHTMRQDAEERKRGNPAKADDGQLPHKEDEEVVVVSGDRDEERLAKRAVGDSASESLVESAPRRIRFAYVGDKIKAVGKTMCCPILAVHAGMHGNAQWYILTGIVEVCTVTLYFLAMQHLYVSYLLALKRGGSVVLSVAGGAFFFGEPVTRREQLCIGLMALGVCLVVLS